VKSPIIEVVERNTIIVTSGCPAGERTNEAGAQAAPPNGRQTSPRRTSRTGITPGAAGESDRTTNSPWDEASIRVLGEVGDVGFFLLHNARDYFGNHAAPPASFPAPCAVVTTPRLEKRRGHDRDRDVSPG
jgi:hypothetical protein